MGKRTKKSAMVGKALKSEGSKLNILVQIMGFCPCFYLGFDEIWYGAKNEFKTAPTSGYPELSAAEAHTFFLNSDFLYYSPPLSLV